MKKSLLLAGILAVGLANAQTGKVGINTENPNETLEINGTLRVDNLPETGVGKIYDGAETAGTTFIGTRTLVADEKGNIGYTTASTGTSMTIPFAKAIVGGDGKDAVSTIDTRTSAFSNSNSINHPIKSGTFTLDKNSLVLVNVALTTSIVSEEKVTKENITLSNGTTGTANLQKFGPETKRYGFEFDIKQGDTVVARIVNSIPLTQSDLSQLDYLTGQVTGQFGATGSRAIVLEKNVEYSYELRYRFQKNSNDKIDYVIHIGNNSSSDVLDIIAIPLEL